MFTIAINPSSKDEGIYNPPKSPFDKGAFFFGVANRLFDKGDFFVGGANPLFDKGNFFAGIGYLPTHFLLYAHTFLLYIYA